MIYVLSQKAIAHFAGVGESAISMGIKRKSLVAARMELEIPGNFKGVTLDSAGVYFGWTPERVNEIKDILDNLPNRIFQIRRAKGTNDDPHRTEGVWFYEPDGLAANTPPWENDDRS